MATFSSNTTIKVSPNPINVTSTKTNTGTTSSFYTAGSTVHGLVTVVLQLTSTNFPVEAQLLVADQPVVWVRLTAALTASWGLPYSTTTGVEIGPTQTVKIKVVAGDGTTTANAWVTGTEFANSP